MKNKQTCNHSPKLVTLERVYLVDTKPAFYDIHTCKCGVHVRTILSEDQETGLDEILGNVVDSED